MAEGWLREHLPAAQWSIVRPAAVWGPGDTTITERVVSFLRWSPFICISGPGGPEPLAARARAQRRVGLFLAAAEPAAFGQAINVLDREVSTVDDVYRFLAAIYLPGKRFRTLCLPSAWCGPSRPPCRGSATHSSWTGPARIRRCTPLHRQPKPVLLEHPWLRLMERANLPVVSRTRDSANWHAWQRGAIPIGARRPRHHFSAGKGAIQILRYCTALPWSWRRMGPGLSKLALRAGGRAGDLEVLVDQHPVVLERQARRRRLGALGVEARRAELHVVGLPLQRWGAHVDPGPGDVVEAATFVIQPLEPVAVEDLHLVAPWMYTPLLPRPWPLASA